jgi:hypothetical protein
MDLLFEFSTGNPLQTTTRQSTDSGVNEFQLKSTELSSPYYKFEQSATRKRDSFL